MFFAATKLFQAKDPHLRRMVYLCIKDICPGSDEVCVHVCLRVVEWLRRPDARVLGSGRPGARQAASKRAARARRGSSGRGCVLRRRRSLAAAAAAAAGGGLESRGCVQEALAGIGWPAAAADTQRAAQLPCGGTQQKNARPRPGHSRAKAAAGTELKPVWSARRLAQGCGVCGVCG